MAEERKKEEWRLIEGTEDYFISSRGRFKHGKKLLKTKPGKDGYPRCNLGKNKKRVHRLVAEAFIPNPNNLPVVDHIDGCKTNNNVENLRWVTQQENVQAAYDTGLFANVGKHRDKAVAVFTEDDNCYVFDTLVEAAKFADVPRDAISRIFRGIDKQIRGYRFMRVNSLHDYRISKGDNDG